LKDKINRLPVIKVSNKAKALDIIIGQKEELRVSHLSQTFFDYLIKLTFIFIQVCTVVSNNTIELHSIFITEKCKEPQCLRILSSHGHRTDIRAIYFSSDSLAFVTVSEDSIKLWSRFIITFHKYIKYYHI
jgi:U3 small nucleolar RNA-associated protein 12